MDLSLALAGCRALACSTLMHEVSRQVYVNVAESRADRSQAQGMCASGQPLGSLTRTILHAPDGTLPGSMSACPLTPICVALRKYCFITR